MLKEEKALRKLVRIYLTNYDLDQSPCVNYVGEKQVREYISALVRAVKDDDLRIYREVCVKFGKKGFTYDQLDFAIRGKK